MCKKYSVQEVFNLIGEECLNIPMVSHSARENITVDGYQVYRKSMRYATFYQKGVKCVCCGKEGTYFQLDADREGGNIENRRHFNLYAEDGTLMTKDHILPKKWGGQDHIDNFQTMCKDCNEAKGSQYEIEIDGIVAISVQNTDNIHQYISLEDAVYGASKLLHICDKQGIKKSTIVKKSIECTIKLMSALETGTPYLNYIWKKQKFKVQGKAFEGKED